MPNPYLPPEAATGTDPPPTIEDHGVGSRFRFAIIPATLSFLLAGLLAVGIVSWVIQAIEVSETERTTPLRFAIVAVLMTATLAVGSMANLLAGRKWLRRQFLTALSLNFGSWFVLYLTIQILERVINPPL
ncbi:hypothetical protein [Candidatus Laterigemmans baculatus]|uniref:hypothetical protein n=1 Tax=Candidatus Laterigemmans baculatus TaxID=2770505 RepID=UPI0013DBBAE0|nr:hypothetical protein [Candidatus Laterigemmans baculatus]